MSEMVKRVARALLALENPGADPDEPEFHAATAIGDKLRPIPRWRLFENRARTVIAEIREPTEAMVSRVEIAGVVLPGKSEAEHRLEQIKTDWRAMIDAALA